MPWPIRFGPEPRMMHGRPLARRDLGLLVVGRVVVRRRGGELGRAGVDGLVDRPDAEGVPDAAHDRLGQPAQRAELGVGEAVPLGPPQQARAQLGGGRDLARRSRRSARSGRGTTGRCRSPRAPARRSPRRGAPAAPPGAARRSAGQRPRSSSSTSPGSPRPVERRARPARARSAFCSASVKLRPIAIASPTLFIVVVSVGSAAGNFSNANRGTLTTT